MRILVCGSRYWTDRDIIREALELQPRDSVVVHGAARGADRIAGEVARELGMAVQEYPADWHLYGRKAGMIRNQAMLVPAPDIVLAFTSNLPTSRGTADMVARARSRNIPVMIFGEATGGR